MINKRNIISTIILCLVVVATSFLIYILVPIIRLGSSYNYLIIIDIIAIAVFVIATLFLIIKTLSDELIKNIFFYLFCIILTSGVLLTIILKIISLCNKDFFANKTGLISVVIFVAYYIAIFLYGFNKYRASKTKTIDL